jgi:hypothetical protein
MLDHKPKLTRELPDDRIRRIRRRQHRGDGAAQ